MKLHFVWIGWIIMIGITIACVILSACSQTSQHSILTPTLFSTPDIPNWGSTPSNPKYAHYMPDELSCVLVPAVRPQSGVITWQGLTVGISTFEDVKQALVTDNNISYGWDTITGSMFFGNSYSIPTTWTIVTTCFVEGKLAAMNIKWAKEFNNMTLQDIIAKYGNPDRVTWANFYEYRSLLWSEKGLLIVVKEYSNKVHVASVILFSPVLRCQLEQSWVYESLPKKGQIDMGDVHQTILNIEDPWKIEKGLSDCPKK